MKRAWPLAFLTLLCSAPCVAEERKASTCFGDTPNGALAHGWQLPSSGPNFEAYSSLGVMAGRNYVHSKVHEVVVRSYALLEKSAPGKRFQYGETGFEKGGRFEPHKTHQNGLSVDFFVPVTNARGESVTLPAHAFNRLGYDIEFDADARYEELAIDFEALAKHLRAVKQAADETGVGIRVVIFDNAYQKKLKATPTGKTLPPLLTFSTRKPWVRHDEHYHIDFIVPCKKRG